jgi:hypothetical protein
MPRVIETPAAPFDKAAHMGELQLKSMMESSTIKEVLHEVLDVHTEIHQFAQSLGHRQQAARRLEEANKLNLKLFQRMISEIVMLHRQKFQSQTAQCAALEEQVEYLQSVLSQCQEELAIGKRRIQKSDLRCEEFELLCKAKDSELTLLSIQLATLQASQGEYLRQLEAQRIERKAEQEEMKARYNQALNDEKRLLNEQRHEMLLQVADHLVTLTTPHTSPLLLLLASSCAKMTCTTSRCSCKRSEGIDRRSRPRDPRTAPLVRRPATPPLKPSWMILVSGTSKTGGVSPSLAQSSHGITGNERLGSLLVPPAKVQAGTSPELHCSSTNSNEASWRTTLK